MTRHKLFAMGSIVSTITSFILLFVTAYFHDVGDHAPQALSAMVGCAVSFFAAILFILAAQEELL